MGKRGALLLAASLMLAAPAIAEDRLAEAERGAREAIAKLMQSLGRMVGAVPSYAAPEVLPNGDILIRRKPKARPAEAPNAEDSLRL